MLLCTIYYDDDSFQDWTGNQFARGPNEFFLKPDTGGLGVLVGPGIVVHDLPVARLLLRRSRIHAWIRDREQVKIKGFIRTAAKLYNCVGAPVSALKDRQCFSTLQPKRVVQFLAQQHTRLCDASDAAPEASFPLLGSFSALVQSSLPPLSAASFGAP